MAKVKELDLANMTTGKGARFMEGTLAWQQRGIGISDLLEAAVKLISEFNFNE